MNTKWVVLLVASMLVAPDSVANALHYASDHLPVFAESSFDNITAVGREETGPITYALEQNCPNPFNLSTVISYPIPAGQLASLMIYDELGREVVTLVQGELSSWFSQNNSQSN